MLNLKGMNGKKRVLSIDRKRLTLSGSKITISSLSSELIRFFQPENSSQNQDTNAIRLKDKPKYTPYPKNSQAEMQLSEDQHTRVDDYGIFYSKRAQNKPGFKSSQFHQKENKCLKRVGSLNLQRQALNGPEKKRVDSCYFSFTFGKENFKLKKKREPSERFLKTQ